MSPTDISRGALGRLAPQAKISVIATLVSSAFLLAAGILFAARDPGAWFAIVYLTVAAAWFLFQVWNAALFFTGRRTATSHRVRAERPE